MFALHQRFPASLLKASGTTLRHTTNTFFRYGYTSIGSITTIKDPIRCIHKLNERHVHIHNTLNAFHNFANVFQNNNVTRNGKLVSDLNHFITFFKEYSRGIMFQIEENLLFPGIRDYGFSVIPRHAGIYLQDEHETYRRYLAMISSGLDSCTDDPNAICSAIKDFVPFFAAHAHKEEKYLYPEIIKKTPSESMEIISQNTDKFVEDNMEKEQKLLKISSDLCDKYGADKVDEPDDTNSFAYFDDI